MAGSNGDVPEFGQDMTDEEALEYAIALSLREQDAGAAAKEPEQPKPQESSSSSNTTFGSLMLDRKKMEEERLRRLEKRRRPSSDDDVVEIPPPKRQAPSKQDVPKASTTLPFPDGVVKTTWARGYPRTDDDIKIEEVFQKDSLQLAVISSFQWDEEWMMSKLNMAKTKLLLVAFASDEDQQEAMVANAPRNVRFCFPPMNGPGSMHSKLQLLKYPDYLRVVLPTGNLVPYDWGETGVMENMVFLIDLPRLTDSAAHQPTTFITELGRFLSEAGVDEAMASSLGNYDVSRTRDLRFVYSIPGSHTGDSFKRVGYCGLGTSVASLGLATSSPVDVDSVSASLGAVNYDLISAIYNACQGDDGLKEYNSRTKRTGRSKDSKSLAPQFADRFRVYFPTENTVARSRGGRPAAGTICIQEKWWRASTFPHELMRDCINNRDGLLMHTKLLLVRRKPEGQPEAVQPAAWAYVGSANLSESAWGRLVKDRATGRPKMTCRNWECGVIVRVPEVKAAAGPAGTETNNTQRIFKGTVPVPMECPGRQYGPTDQPWFYRS